MLSMCEEEREEETLPQMKEYRKTVAVLMSLWLPTSVSCLCIFMLAIFFWGKCGPNRDAMNMNVIAVHVFYLFCAGIYQFCTYLNGNYKIITSNISKAGNKHHEPHVVNLMEPR